MKIKQGQQTAYDAYKAANSTDPYSHCVVTYAEDWANLMEAGIACGQAIASIAQTTRDQADTDGVTGFMHGCAVSALARFWEHGEELRKWHNLDTQIGDEGVKANESGGVLNPALLNVSVKQ